MDYDRSEIINKNIISLPQYNESYTLLYNLIKSISALANLLLFEDSLILKNGIDKALKVFNWDLIGGAEKILRSYYKGNRDYEDYVEISTRDSISFINEFTKIIYDEYLFPEYTLNGNK